MADVEALQARVRELEAAVETEKAKARMACRRRLRRSPPCDARDARRVCISRVSRAPVCSRALTRARGLLAGTASLSRQADAATVNAEQAGQALEQRYTALAEEHAKARAAARAPGAAARSRRMQQP